MKKLLTAVLLASAAHAEDAKAVKLEFKPGAGAVLVVALTEDVAWDYKGRENRGVMHTELTLRWTFGERGSGKAAFERLARSGKGVSKTTKWTTDLEWTAKDGWVKGKEGDDAAVADEIKKGLSLTFDAKATADKGEC